MTEFRATSQVILIAGALSGMLLGGCGPSEIREGTLISVFYTTDTRGKLEGCGCKKNGGGITKRSAKLAAVRDEDPNIIYCDSGNFLTGTVDNDEAGGMISVKAYNHMRADVVNISERELALGVDVFKTARASSDFEYVSANVRVDGKAPADPYVIRTVKGVRVAFVGLCGSTEVMRYDSARLPSGVTIVDPMKAARKVLPSLSTNTDLIIVLSTCGDHVDSLLADTFENVNLVIGGRTFRANEAKPWVVGETRIVLASRDGKTMGRMDMVFGVDRKIKTFSASRIMMETSDPSDEAMLALVREYIPQFVDNPKEGVRIKKDAEEEKK